jgi:hypothetical protein
MKDWLMIAASTVVIGVCGAVWAQLPYHGDVGHEFGRRHCGRGTNAMVQYKHQCKQCCNAASWRGYLVGSREVRGCKDFCRNMWEP